MASEPLPFPAPEPACTQEVLVREIRVAADIGAYAHEMGRRQALLVSVRLTVVPPASDHLGETIDYNRIVAHALALGEERIALIETFAQRLARACLGHAEVRAAEVVVEKPGALTNGVASTRVVMGA